MNLEDILLELEKAISEQHNMLKSGMANMPSEKYMYYTEKLLQHAEHPKKLKKLKETK